MHTYTQDVLECSFYHVLDGLTVENNHFDGRYRGYVLALAHCAALPTPEAAAAFFSAGTFRCRFSTKPNDPHGRRDRGRITAVVICTR